MANNYRNCQWDHSPAILLPPPPAPHCDGPHFFPNEHNSTCYRVVHRLPFVSFPIYDVRKNNFDNIYWDPCRKRPSCCATALSRGGTALGRWRGEPTSSPPDPNTCKYMSFHNWNRLASILLFAVPSMRRRGTNCTGYCTKPLTQTVNFEPEV